jgi:hypothetical protein
MQVWRDPDPTHVAWADPKVATSTDNNASFFIFYSPIVGKMACRYAFNSLIINRKRFLSSPLYGIFLPFVMGYTVYSYSAFVPRKPFHTAKRTTKWTVTFLNRNFSAQVYSYVLGAEG